MLLAPRLRSALCAAAPLPSPARALLRRLVSGGSAAPSAPAAAGVSPYASTNVTLPSPSLHGPLSLPAGVPVWKRRPGARASLLYERTPREMLKNTQYLAAGPHDAPRPEPVHRQLRAVSDEASLELAVRGIHSMHSARTKFTTQTASLLVEAALRAGQPGVALDAFLQKNVRCVGAGGMLEEATQR